MKHVISIAEGKTFFHRTLRLCFVVVSAVIAMLYLEFFLRVVLAKWLGIDMDTPVRLLENQWLPDALVILTALSGILVFILMLKLSSWLFRVLRI
jgi:hypothetical protein